MHRGKTRPPTSESQGLICTEFHRPTTVADCRTEVNNLLARFVLEKKGKMKSLLSHRSMIGIPIEHSINNGAAPSIRAYTAEDRRSMVSPPQRGQQ